MKNLTNVNGDSPTVSVYRSHTVLIKKVCYSKSGISATCNVITETTSTFLNLLKFRKEYFLYTRAELCSSTMKLKGCRIGITFFVLKSRHLKRLHPVGLRISMGQEVLYHVESPSCFTIILPAE